MPITLGVKGIAP